MTRLTAAVREHAKIVGAGQLERVNGRLASLTLEQRRAVDELARNLPALIADLLLEEARRNRAFAAALQSSYSATPPAGSSSSAPRRSERTSRPISPRRSQRTEATAASAGVGGTQLTRSASKIVR